MRVAPSGRQQVKDEQMDALVKQVGGLLNERAEGVAACLVAGRDNFHHCHNLVTANMADRNRVLLAPVVFHVGLCAGKDLRRREHYAAVPRRRCAP